MTAFKQLDAGEVSLNKVFSADYDFVIPDYQRPYAWGTEETLQLLDDLDVHWKGPRTSRTSSGPSSWSRRGEPRRPTSSTGNSD